MKIGDKVNISTLHPLIKNIFFFKNFLTLIKRIIIFSSPRVSSTSRLSLVSSLNIRGCRYVKRIFLCAIFFKYFLLYWDVCVLSSALNWHVWAVARSEREEVIDRERGRKREKGKLQGKKFQYLIFYFFGTKKSQELIYNLFPT